MLPTKKPVPTVGQNGERTLGLGKARSAPAVPAQPEAWDFERRLDTDTEWALTEGSRHLEGRGSVHEALRKIAGRLNEIGVPYAVVGGMAMFRHGYQRFTEDVDILVTEEGLEVIHEKLEGRGYVPPFAGSKHLRDADLRVKIEFLCTGDYPGDGKPKPVAFPDPAVVGVEHDGIRYVKLESLIEMKLASGMTNPGRLKDLADILEMIKALGLGSDFAHRLNPYVQEKFRELREAAEKSAAQDQAETWVKRRKVAPDDPSTGG